jgi:hypothetical protein
VIPFNVYEFNEIWYSEMHNLCKRENNMFTLFAAFYLILDRIQCSTRAVQEVSIHFEYLENWSRGLEVTWQPVRGDFTAHSRTVTLPWG